MKSLLFCVMGAFSLSFVVEGLDFADIFGDDLEPFDKFQMDDKFLDFHINENFKFDDISPSDDVSKVADIFKFADTTQNDDKFSWLSCNEEEKETKCFVQIPNKEANNECSLVRNKQIQMSRQYYKLTEFGKKSIIKFPLTFLPFLNQTIETVSFHAALDEVDSRWMARLIMYQQFIKTMQKTLLEKTEAMKFDNPKDYITASYIHDQMIKYLRQPKDFANPSFDPSYTDVIYNQLVLTKADEIFVQKRFAGLCPFLLKLVTTSGRIGTNWNRLKQMLNPTFDFDSALKEAMGDDSMTMERAADASMLYVLHHKENDRVMTVPDFYKNDLYNMTSPIALFARKTTGDVVAVAIQLDYLPSSQVYTPASDPFMWQFAKAMVDHGDINICQAIWHLGDIHLASGPYCAIFRSHLSRLHPLHEIMRFHCEGTTSHIAITYGSLFAPDSFGATTFAMGAKGYANLTVAGYNKYRYGKLSYYNIMRRHGLDKNHIKYYPFREDGKMIWDEFKRFANQFVNTFYKSDNDLKEDEELQSFARQLSVRGEGDHYGGKGNIHGFPSSFQKRMQLRVFVSRFLWIIALHGVVNYPLEPYGAFSPMYPTKLYNTQGDDPLRIYRAMPDRPTTIGAISFATILGNMRVNRIFDYSEKVESWKLKRLVGKFYNRFHKCLQGEFEKRNAQRKKNGQLGLQYLEPKWLTNSVHI